MSIMGIGPNTLGYAIDSIDSEKVIVSWKEKDSSDSVIMINPEKNE